MENLEVLANALERIEHLASGIAGFRWLEGGGNRRVVSGEIVGKANEIVMLVQMAERCLGEALGARNSVSDSGSAPEETRNDHGKLCEWCSERVWFGACGCGATSSERTLDALRKMLAELREIKTNLASSKKTP